MVGLWQGRERVGPIVVCLFFCIGDLNTEFVRGFWGGSEKERRREEGKGRGKKMEI